MRSLFIGLSATIHQAVRRLAMLSLLLMFVTMLVQIFARYGFDAPPTWTEEVARYLMVWTGLLGATMSFHQRADAVLMDSVMPARLRGLAHGLQSAAVLVFVLPVLYFSFFSWRGVWGQGYLGRAARLTADTLGVSMVWISMAVPMCAGIIVIHLVARWCGAREGHAQDASVA